MRFKQTAVLSSLCLFLIGALTGCPLLLGPGQAGNLMFFATPSSGPAPLQVRFFGMAVLAPPYEADSWSWDFGDGSSGNGRAINHTFVNPGTYNVTLNVSVSAAKFRGEQDPPPALLTYSQEVTVVLGNLPPVADAGPDQSVTLPIGGTPSPVVLDGSASYDPEEQPITYAWQFVSRPEGNQSVLDGADTVNPTFVPDRKGDYVIRLIVNDGVSDSEPDTVVVHVANRPPVAVAGPDQTGAFIGTTVALDGSASSDPDNDPLTYAWSTVTAPEGSQAALVNPNTVNPTFTPDRKGDYVIQLIVNDGEVNSPADTLTVTVGNRAPVADAGPEQAHHLDTIVTMDGSGSSDPDGDSLLYAWSITGRPQGSEATLANADTVNPTFTPDRKGEYTLTLIVNDGTVDSAPDTTHVTIQNRPPVADAGPDQDVYLGQQLVTLDGTGSSDPDGDPITAYVWVLVDAPDGSGASLTGADSAHPTFIPDRKGDYVFQLDVSDGTDGSVEADTVVITVLNRPPVADAGPDQPTVYLGDVVTLDGSGSSDPDGDSLSYVWSMTTPAGSEATLTGAEGPDPTFEPDLKGDYLLQLIVNDGEADSEPDTVTVTVVNRPPVAVGVVLPGNEATGDVGRITDSDVLTPNTDILYGLPIWQMMGKAFGFDLHLIEIDQTTADFNNQIPITVLIEDETYFLPFHVREGRGLAVDPVTGEMWAIVWFDRADNWDGPFRALVRINPRTGVAIPVGDPLTTSLSEFYTGLAVDNTGVLIGVTYNEQDEPQKAVDMYHSIYEISKIDTSETFILQYPEPVDVDVTPGETIAFNTDDGLLYHATGDVEAIPAGRLFRSFDLVETLSTLTLTPGETSWEEPRAMTYVPGASQFYLADVGMERFPGLFLLTLADGVVTEEFIGTLELEDGMYPLGMNGLAFRYDREFPAPVVNLDATQSSDPEGDNLTYHWTFDSWPAGSLVDDSSLSSTTSPTPSFTPDLIGTYVLELTVNDGEADSEPVTVTVNFNNVPPVADAGTDQTIPEGEYYTPVQINGSGSYDPDSEDLAFLWTFLSVPTGSTLDDSWIDVETAAPSFYADVASDTEPYVLQLTVTDPDGETDVDTVQVYVNEAPQNE